ncbi:putative periplasmic serine endoprotease DegP-like precursor [Aureliella helgolandensis]|uniref:Putative periplasmic serine endoprotease DegP-like n=2 Tax=Aureliella helgolandensis TaxID=2527968 RepID=A0A518GFM1_9BACT|nr:putative periplasmic serine endoprotease DegP-like precursor [Aureliella helgolandensis]
MLFAHGGPPLAAQVISTDSTSNFPVLNALEEATVSTIATAGQSVVAIARVPKKQAPSAQAGALRLGGDFSFFESPESPDYIPAFFGSGVVLTEDGLLVTCGHVLGDPQRNDYYVWLDKRSYPAEVVAKPARVFAFDPFSDLAVLKIDATGLQPIRVNPSRELRKGQFVVALGNPEAVARDGQASASWGIISNLRRVAPAVAESNPAASRETVHQYGTLIQTDARLSLGTSGGALINLHGEMVGLTTSLVAVEGNADAAGFAIAVDQLFLRVIESLKLGRLPEYGFLGIQPEELRIADRRRGFSGAKIVSVLQGLPGEQAGLQAEDIVFQINDETITDRNGLFRELAKVGAGESLQMHVQRPVSRGGTPRVLVLTAKLGKKFVATHRPGYALNTPKQWRGMLVEYATAIPAAVLAGGRVGGQGGGAAARLGVLSVDPGTPAWESGLRPGYGILEVDGQPVNNPDEFYAAVEGSVGDVSILVVPATGSSRTLRIADSPPEN